MTETPQTSTGDPGDDALQATLGEAMQRVEPVPGHVTDAARAAFGWRDLDAELALLSFDSLSDSAGVRSGDSNRQLTFQAGDLEIEVMITDNGTSRMIGQLVPPQASRIEVISGEQRYEVQADGSGRFDVDGIFGGPSRLVVHGDVAVRTDWITL
jgi:hypothetical protein